MATLFLSYKYEDRDIAEKLQKELQVLGHTIQIDANIVLRYLLDDHPVLSPKSATIIEQQAVTLPIEAACEVVYVLQKVYSVERPQIQKTLSDLLDQQLVFMEKPDLFLKAPECYGTTTFDIVDTLLWAYHAIGKHVVLTFDEKLKKYISQTSPPA